MEIYSSYIADNGAIGTCCRISVKIFISKLIVHVIDHFVVSATLYV